MDSLVAEAAIALGQHQSFDEVLLVWPGRRGEVMVWQRPRHVVAGSRGVHQPTPLPLRRLLVWVEEEITPLVVARVRMALGIH
ncbi:MAG: hypothetical protein ABW005_15575 [Burkholderiaceae bacterium]